MSVALPVAGSVGNLYTITPDNWIAINDRAKVVVADQGVAQEIVRYIPNFDALVPVCEQWSSHTFPGILTQAASTDTFATQAAKTLTELSQDLKPLKPDDPLPDSIKFIFTVQFAALHDTSKTHLTSFTSLALQTNDFVKENSTADVALQKVIGQLGPDWQSIAGPVATLDNGMEQVKQGWSSVATAFAAAANSPTTLTTAELLALDTQAAIASWKSVSTNATAFLSTLSSP